MIILTILGALCFALTALPVLFMLNSYIEESANYTTICNGYSSVCGHRSDIIDKKIEVLLA